MPPSNSETICRSFTKSMLRVFSIESPLKIRTGSDSDQSKSQLVKNAYHVGDSKLTDRLVAIAPSSDFVLPCI